MVEATFISLVPDVQGTLDSKTAQALAKAMHFAYWEELGGNWARVRVYDGGTSFFLDDENDPILCTAGCESPGVPKRVQKMSINAIKWHEQLYSMGQPPRKDPFASWWNWRRHLGLATWMATRFHRDRRVQQNIWIWNQHIDLARISKVFEPTNNINPL